MSSTHLLLGPEEGEKNAHIARLVEIAHKQSGEKPELHTFYSSETPIRDVIAVLRNGSLFYAHVVAIVHAAEEIRKKDDIAALSDYIRKPSSEATLILVSGVLRIDAAWTREVPADARKIFWEMFENQKQGWVANYFRKRNVAIDADAIELFLDMVENNTQELRIAADRLCGFVGKGGAVTSAEIEEFLYHGKQENVFSLFDGLCAGSLESSLEILQMLLLSNDQTPTGVLASLVWQFRRLLALRVLLDQHYDTSEAFQKLGVRSKRNQQTYSAGIRRFKRAALEDIVTRAVEYEALFRSTSTGRHRGLLQQFIYNTVVRAGAQHLPQSVIYGA
ncbi:MAG: DNA polymerase III subunit delta [Spirochaetaceae bacterium]|nr:MAG: DNA polymerase III subunit delta [Spirochaetaceae bacterium]